MSLIQTIFNQLQDSVRSNDGCFHYSISIQSGSKRSGQFSKDLSWLRYRLKERFLFGSFQALGAITVIHVDPDGFLAADLLISIPVEIDPKRILGYVDEAWEGAGRRADQIAVSVTDADWVETHVKWVDRYSLSSNIDWKNTNYGRSVVFTSTRPMVVQSKSESKRSVLDFFEDEALRLVETSQ